MSDLILSLPHYHRHIAIYVVQIIDTMLGCMCLLRDLRFTLLYVVVSISTYSCLNAHNHNICIRLAQKVVLRENWHSSLLVKIAKHKYLPLLP